MYFLDVVRISYSFAEFSYSYDVGQVHNEKYVSIPSSAHSLVLNYPHATLLWALFTMLALREQLLLWKVCCQSSGEELKHLGAVKQKSEKSGPYNQKKDGSHITAVSVFPAVLFKHILHAHTRRLLLFYLLHDSPSSWTSTKWLAHVPPAAFYLIKLLDELLADHACHGTFGFLYFKGQRKSFF